MCVRTFLIRAKYLLFIYENNTIIQSTHTYDNKISPSVEYLVGRKKKKKTYRTKCERVACSFVNGKRHHTWKSVGTTHREGWKTRYRHIVNIVDWQWRNDKAIDLFASSTDDFIALFQNKKNSNMTAVTDGSYGSRQPSRDQSSFASIAKLSVCREKQVVVTRCYCSLPLSHRCNHIIL